MLDISNPLKIKSSFHWRNMMIEEIIKEDERKILIIHPGSSTLKIGFSTQEHPKIIPHCVFTTNIYFSHGRKDYCASNWSENNKASQEEEERKIRLINL